MLESYSLREHFNKLPEYRDERYITHSLENIIAISISAIICGANDWYDIEDFGRSKIEWFKTFLNVENGVPSHDTYRRFFGCVNEEELERCFQSWVKSIAGIKEGRFIHIDGKTLRGSKSEEGQYFVHMVSAWCSSTGLVLGQQKTEEKSNEITAVPKLLDLLIVQGCVVTLDAISCQRSIAEKIIEKGADYILAVKENQKFLYQDILDAFANEKPLEIYKHSNVGHGRIEKRTTSIITNLDWVCKESNWKALQTLVQVEAVREDKKTGIIQQSIRYYISSKAASAQFFHNAIRDHWTVENQLHWVLDVDFGEDASKKQMKNSAQNFSLFNKIALNLLGNYEVPNYNSAKKMSLKRKRNIAAWNNDNILKMLWA